MTRTICHFTTSLSRTAGGLYYSVSGLAKAQRDMGFRVIVIGGADTCFEEDRYIWEDLDIRPYYLGNKYGLSLAGARLVSKVSADIFHVHGIWSASTMYGLLASFRGIHTVVSPRGMLDPWILNRRRIYKIIHSMLFERPLLRRSVLHSLSATETEHIESFTSNSHTGLFQIPNGTLPVLTSNKVAKQGALFLGRLHEKKQVLELIKLWQSLPMNIDIPLTIAGWGNEDYAMAVRKAAEKSSNIKFVGSKYGQDKTTLLQQSRFFILPSLGEGLPMAVLEALQFGCIPMLTDQCNLPELFESNVALRLETDLCNLHSTLENMLLQGDDWLNEKGAKATIAGMNYLWPSIALRIVEQYENHCWSNHSQNNCPTI